LSKRRNQLQSRQDQQNVKAVQLVEKARAQGSVLAKFNDLYQEAFAHDGFAEIRVEMRILRRGQKEVILHCGKQYRFVVDCPFMASEDGEPRVERRKRQESINFPDRRKRGRG
jgi:hypothetical protein